VVRFLHTADWQLGMRRHFLDADAQARFADARIDAIRSLGEVAGTEQCAFVVVAGDVFESNQVDRRTIRRALDAMATIPVPVYLLPGNHDALDAGSLYRAPAFAAACPAHVHVLTDAVPVQVAPGVELVAAPWPSRRPAIDLVTAALDELAPAAGSTRVMVAHGAVADGVFGASANSIALDAVHTALADGRIAFLALGDRHSTTAVGRSGRVWYSGAPEPTDFDETDPGNVLVVDLAPDACTVVAHRVARWTYHRLIVDLASVADVDGLAADLDRLPAKDRTILRLGFRGTVGLATRARLDALLADLADRFAAVTDWEAGSDLLVVPDDHDLAALDVSGFARAALDRLVAAAGSATPEAVTARDALALLHRLAA